jgi:hypothetical protein
MEILNNDFSDIILSNKPDKDFEIFWLTFKNSIKDIIPKNMLLILKKYSEELNVLQQEKQYDKIIIKITDFMEKYLILITKIIILKGNGLKILHLTCNINRWKHFDEKFKIDCMLEVQLAILLASYYKKKNIYYNEVLNLIKIYINITIDTTITSTNIEKYDKLKIFFEFAIEKKLSSIINILRNFINITIFMKEGYEHKNYMNARSHKLLKYIEIKN